jgi:hypothetical protein
VLKEATIIEDIISTGKSVAAFGVLLARLQPRRKARDETALTE